MNYIREIIGTAPVGSSCILSCNVVSAGRFYNFRAVKKPDGKVVFNNECEIADVNNVISDGGKAVAILYSSIDGTRQVNRWSISGNRVIATAPDDLCEMHSKVYEGSKATYVEGSYLSSIFDSQLVV